MKFMEMAAMKKMGGGSATPKAAAKPAAKPAKKKGKKGRKAAASSAKAPNPNRPKELQGKAGRNPAKRGAIIRKFNAGVYKKVKVRKAGGGYTTTKTLKLKPGWNQVIVGKEGIYKKYALRHNGKIVKGSMWIAKGQYRFKGKGKRSRFVNPVEHTDKKVNQPRAKAAGGAKKMAGASPAKGRRVAA